MTTENLKLFVSTPFRTRGSRTYFSDALFGVGNTLKTRYVNALIAEIEVASLGMENMLVDEIEFGNGSIGALATQDLAAIMRTIRHNFCLDDSVLIHALEVPGGMTVDFAGFCKNEKFEYVEIEMLSTDVQVLEKLSLPPSLDPTIACFQVIYFTGAPALGIKLDAAINSDMHAFRHSVIDALGRNPLFIRAVHLNAEQNEAMSKLCCERGLVKAGNSIYAQKEFDTLPVTHKNQLGFGVNAISRFDDIQFKTTSLLQTYISSSTNFEAIAAPYAI